MWIGIDYNLDIINKIGSILACLLLYLHPLAIILGMKYDKLYKKYKDNFYYKVLFGVSIIFALFGIYNIVNYMYLNKSKSPYNFLSYPDTKNCHLVWDFPDHYILVLVIAILISIFVFRENKIFWCIIMLYYFLPAIYVHSTNKVSIKNKEKNYNGSYWCWFVAIFSFLLYFGNPHLQKTTKLN